MFVLHKLVRAFHTILHQQGALIRETRKQAWKAGEIILSRANPQVDDDDDNVQLLLVSVPVSISADTGNMAVTKLKSGSISHRYSRARQHKTAYVGFD